MSSSSQLYTRRRDSQLSRRSSRVSTMMGDTQKRSLVVTAPAGANKPDNPGTDKEQMLSKSKTELGLALSEIDEPIFIIEVCVMLPIYQVYPSKTVWQASLPNHGTICPWCHSLCSTDLCFVWKLCPLWTVYLPSAIFHWGNITGGKISSLWCASQFLFLVYWVVCSSVMLDFWTDNFEICFRLPLCLSLYQDVVRQHTHSGIDFVYYIKWPYMFWCHLCSIILIITVWNYYKLTTLLNFKHWSTKDLKKGIVFESF